MSLYFIYALTNIININDTLALWRIKNDFTTNLCVQIKTNDSVTRL
jgi:hypothetical protein